MSLKLILLIALAVIALLILVMTKGPWRWVAFFGFGAACLLGYLLWSGVITIPELLEAMQGLSDA